MSNTTSSSSGSNSSSSGSSGSRKFSLNGADLKKIGTGLLIALAGAGLTYLTNLIPNVDFGAFAPLVVSAWSVVVNIARKYLTDYSAQ